MGERVEELASRFETINNDVISFVESCSDADWQKRTAEEAWPVGVVARHIAVSHAPLAGIAKLLATSQPVPGITMDMANHNNAEHAQQHADCTKAEVIEMLREHGAAAANTVRSLRDEDLGNSAPVALFDRVMTAEQMIKNVLIWHARSHLQNMKDAVA